MIPGIGPKTLRARTLALAVALAACATGAAAQTYPAKTVRFVVPFTAGGPTDIQGRMLGEKLGQRLGQQFIIDNRGGAGGNIGMEITAKAPPDGYTIVIATVGTWAVNPSLYKLPGSPFALSPDGRFIAYLGTDASNPRRVYVRALGELTARELAGTDGATEPFFSPDGAWIGFEAAGQLKKVPATGGTAVFLADVPGLQGASWATPDQIVVSAAGRLAIVPANGGAPRVFALPDSTVVGLRYPLALPDGKSVLFSALPRGGTGASVGM